MNNKTADIWNKVVNRIMKMEKTTREYAEAMVNKQETWLVDMVEAHGEKNVTFLANCIVEN